MGLKATNGVYLKKLNRKRILDSLRRSACSRAELAKRTALSRAAISLLTEELISEGILIETDKISAKAGRRPTMLRLCAHRFYALGISIARDQTKIGFINFEGNVLYAQTVAEDNTAAESVTYMADAIHDMIERHAIDRKKLLGIGISAPGPINVREGTILTPPNLEKWHHFPICERLHHLTNLPVSVENNANSLALAENHYGCGGQHDSMMVMTVDTGIGAGIILNQQLFRGDNGFGSEVGHICVNVNGSLCACGNRGCLELYAARRAILKKAANISPRYDCFEKIVDSAIDGDTGCIQILDYMANYLSIGIVNVLNLFDLEAVVLSGDVVYKPDLLLSNLRQKVNARSMVRNFRKIPLFVSGLHGDVDILCAASIVLDKYFSEI